MFRKFSVILILFMIQASYSKNIGAKVLNYEQLIQTALEHSPLLKAIDAKLNIMDSSTKLANSYYFPTFEIKQRYLSTTNPVNAFGLKLTKKEFKMADFQNIDKLNSPNTESTHQTTLSVYIPINISGSINASKNIINNQSSALQFEKKWIGNEIKKNLYALYYTNFNLFAMDDFLKKERKFLEKVANAYDIKSSENKNRYLSYNQARIILETINEGINSIKLERNKILESVRYLCGAENEDLELAKVLPRELSWQNPNYNINNERIYSRYDLLATSKQMDAASATITKEEKNYWPNLGILGEYNITTGKFDNYAKDRTLGVVLSWNFGMSIPSTVSLAKANYILRKTELESKKAEVLSDTKRLRDELEQLTYSITSMEKKHQFFEENKKILDYQYRRGSVDLYNMLDNFTHYLQNYSQLQTSKSTYRAKLAEYTINFQTEVQ
ncbi:MAG: TolC family protein [Oligoflexia bacterium]|nr:TolC family protein [Oligoflexia bacterium]